ncbi:MAG: hypothetical protein H7061_12060, partial [Bdellovibrionaceae bacterium]|nr:hypothetical protein [Bdellovibrio sp.]
MKTYLITIAFLFSCSTWAENIKVPVGVFKFNHEINILLAKKTEWIDSRNQAGKERVKE